MKIAFSIITLALSALIFMGCGDDAKTSNLFEINFADKNSPRAAKTINPKVVDGYWENVEEKDYPLRVRLQGNSARFAMNCVKQKLVTEAVVPVKIDLSARTIEILADVTRRVENGKTFCSLRFKKGRLGSYEFTSTGINLFNARDFSGNYIKLSELE